MKIMKKNTLKHSVKFRKLFKALIDQEIEDRQEAEKEMRYLYCANQYTSYSEYQEWGEAESGREPHYQF